jgi:putative tryptophan/tyrosine transport system substrate-binding protein
MRRRAFVGFSAALAPPDGNITGITVLATELEGKHLEILQEIVPGMHRMATPVGPRTTAPDQLQALIR